MSVPVQKLMPIPPKLRFRIRVVVLLTAEAVVLAWGQAFGAAVVGILVGLPIAWLLWRSDVESGRS
ncbi:hypothetical protein SPF06_00705 [Sinomonas sp. JGH33]|uniref:Uncharacterized protein n=1 Tax=Sinomonas terricola TaxID=3110330 RepID=A0ABU5T0Q1_9MICC|nr:hypothetical protein [Sinomonas sp. JGH33]MEA5453229.1 hypothetical protein [Sinomonas sp. JGH33]